MPDPGPAAEPAPAVGPSVARAPEQAGLQALEPAEISKFEQERDALLKNPVAVGFLDAQEEMHELQHLVQKHVGKTIELGRIPTADDLDGGSCGQGCGCHGH